MRNSLAHSGKKGIHFLPCQEGGEITSIIFYDNDEEYGGTSEFCVELTIAEIQELSTSISNMYLKVEETSKDNEEKKQMYIQETEYCKRLMEKG